jgi:hypothetical protein
MFDGGTFGRSRLYFAYLQQLRIFVEWINETKADLSSFVENYTCWSKSLVESRPEDISPFEVLISQGELDWMLAKLEKEVNTFQNSFNGLLDRIEKEKKGDRKSP